MSIPDHISLNWSEVKLLLLRRRFAASSRGITGSGVFYRGA